ncbi:MAG TPA: winged helix-turn-helix domain-containing protein [Nitrososphaerales archaeon]|nr:winged helix-turn-helix domain-containing protein [Nitrososphaerales archaeon]
MESQTQVVSENNGARPKGAEPRRSLLQIRMDILRVVAEGSGKPTQIMYKANLSWALLKSQLTAFKDAGLVSVQRYGSRRLYTLTDKGAAILDSYDRIERGLLPER